VSTFDLWRGLCVIWLHKPRGGYGYVIRVPGAVLSWTASKVQLEVIRADGSRVVRQVPRDRIRETSVHHRHGVSMQEDAALDAGKQEVGNAK
jgi:hypothetical protein